MYFSLSNFLFAGATSGIGEETALTLAMRGARLILPARHLGAAAATRRRITEKFPNADIIVLPLDLGSLRSVRQFVALFLSLDLPLHLLMYSLSKHHISRWVSHSLAISSSPSFSETTPGDSLPYTLSPRRALN